MCTSHHMTLQSAPPSTFMAWQGTPSVWPMSGDDRGQQQQMSVRAAETYVKLPPPPLPTWKHFSYIYIQWRHWIGIYLYFKNDSRINKSFWCTNLHKQSKVLWKGFIAAGGPTSHSGEEFVGVYERGFPRLLLCRSGSQWRKVRKPRAREWRSIHRHSVTKHMLETAAVQSTHLNVMPHRWPSFKMFATVCLGWRQRKTKSFLSWPF